MIFVGLGNPGPEYEETRHNAGFLVLAAACRRWPAGAWTRRTHFEENRMRLAGREHRLIRPRTFMNASGDAIAQLLKSNEDPADLLVVLDDVDLPLGRIRIRAEGGPGGHRGLQSILEVAATTQIARMRIGVGRPVPTDGMVAHVLGRFTSDEQVQFAQVLDRALDALHLVVRAGTAAAMSRFNGLPAPWAGSADREPGPDTRLGASGEAPREGE